MKIQIYEEEEMLCFWKKWGPNEEVLLQWFVVVDDEQIARWEKVNAEYWAMQKELGALFRAQEGL